MQGAVLRDKLNNAVSRRLMFSGWVDDNAMSFDRRYKNQTVAIHEQTSEDDHSDAYGSLHDRPGSRQNEKLLLSSQSNVPNEFKSMNSVDSNSKSDQNAFENDGSLMAGSNSQGHQRKPSNQSQRVAGVNKLLQESSSQSSLQEE